MALWLLIVHIMVEFRLRNTGILPFQNGDAATFADPFPKFPFKKSF